MEIANHQWFFSQLNHLTAEQRKHVLCAGPHVDCAELQALGFKVPEYYQIYLNLGRFRDAYLHAYVKRYPAIGKKLFLPQSGYMPMQMAAGIRDFFLNGLE